LINGGKIAFGTGGPDVTIISPLSYNDNTWHFITATRSETGTGTMTLYVDGSQVATTTGVDVSTLSAPTIIGLGRNNCTGADYSGALDDLIFYGRTLSSAEVSALYNTESAVTLAINWVSFSAAAEQNKILLQWQIASSTDDLDFQIERSTDGQNFSSIGTLPSNDNALAQTVSFSFEDGNPENGTDFYRIKQINADGTYSYSKVLSVSFQNTSAGIKLFPNPVFGSQLTISNAAGTLIQEINIIDVSGRKIAGKYLNSPNSSIPVDVNNLSPGYYFIEVISSAKKITIPFAKGS
jgi:hypothetical protein